MPPVPARRPREPAVGSAAGSASPAIDASLRAAQVLDRKGYAYLVHPLCDGVPRCDPALLREWTAWATARPGVADATVLVAPEAMAIPLATALALDTGKPYVVARKRSYGLPGEEVAAARTGYGSAALHVNGIGAGDRVLVVDDILSTGGTLAALLPAIRATGADVAGVLVFLDKGDARNALQDTLQVAIHVMRKVQVSMSGLRMETPH